MMAACINILLRDHVTVPRYRGNLHMPPDASPSAHIDTRKEFLRIMNRWKKKHKYIFAIHAIMHIVDDLNIHWDCQAYSDAPVKALRREVSDAWRRAGGLRQSLVPMDAAEIGKACRYAAKDADPSRNRRVLLLPRSQKDIGLNLFWHAGNFWAGHKRADLWKVAYTEWYPPEVSNTEYTTLEPSTDHDADKNPHQDGGPESPLVTAVRRDLEGGRFGSKVVYSVLDTAAKTALLAEIDRRLEEMVPRWENANLRAVIPTTAADAVLVERLAEDAGVTVDSAEQYVRSGAVEKVERARGKYTDPLWWRDAPPPPPPVRPGESHQDYRSRIAPPPR